MTAINLAVQPKRRAAYIISDCAYTAPDDARVVRIGGKIISFERFPCAIGITGSIDIIATARALFALDARNLRTLVAGLPKALRTAVRETQAAHPEFGEVFGSLKVAAWCSRRARPTGYLIHSTAEAAMAMLGPGWGAYEVAEAKSSAATHQQPSELLGRPCDLDDPDTFDPERDAFALIAAQRAGGALNITPGCDSYPYRIGGEVELTEVTRRGVKVWSMGKFPDRVGERIDPHRT